MLALYNWVTFTFQTTSVLNKYLITTAKAGVTSPPYQGGTKGGVFWNTLNCWLCLFLQPPTPPSGRRLSGFAIQTGPPDRPFLRGNYPYSAIHSYFKKKSEYLGQL